MLHLTLLSVGKLKNKPVAALCQDFEKRLGRYCRFQCIQVKDTRGKSREQTREAEGRELLERVPAGTVLVALDERGKQQSSVELANWISKLAGRGESRFCFVIGGPGGLSSAVIDRAQLVLSLSKMTFTHEFARVMLTEQLYRAMTIQKGEPYHRE